MDKKTLGEGVFMNRFKLVLLLVLVSLIFIHVGSAEDCYASSIVESGDCGENLTYTLDSDGLLTITGAGKMDEYVSPFVRDERIVSVIIEPGIQRLPGYMFMECSSLEYVSIPNTVASIGDGAFSGCEKLKAISIPDSVTSIETNAFASCTSLTGIVIPEGVVSIGKWAFSSCSGITNVYIPKSVTALGDGVFYLCRSIKDLKVDPDNPAYVSISNVIYTRDMDKLVQCANVNSGEFIIPESVTQIGAHAFHGCRSITKIIIPDSVCQIGEYAFARCTSLKSINIPDCISVIENSVFLYCTSLESISLPECVKSIGRSAFKDCDKIAEIYIPLNVNEIKWGTFYGCDSLKSVTFSVNIKSVDLAAFRDCKVLTDIYYSGSKEEWDSITIEESANEPLFSANIHYNCGVSTITKTYQLAIPSDGSVVDVVYYPSSSTIDFTGDINNRRPLVIAYYNKDGRVLQVLCLTNESVVKVANRTAEINVFWIDQGGIPQTNSLSFPK